MAASTSMAKVDGSGTGAIDPPADGSAVMDPPADGPPG